MACSFWLVDCLHMIGREEEATELFERLLALRNDLGLLSEEYDPLAGRLVGNFPQAFSHVSLINSAFRLSGSDPLGASRRRSRLIMDEASSSRPVTSDQAPQPHGRAPRARRASPATAERTRKRGHDVSRGVIEVNAP